MRTLKLEHNLSDTELEYALEKALKGIKSMRELPKELPNKLANEIISDNETIYNKVIENMLSEIKSVLEQK